MLQRHSHQHIQPFCLEISMRYIYVVLKCRIYVILCLLQVKIFVTPMSQKSGKAANAKRRTKTSNSRRTKCR